MEPALGYNPKGRSFFFLSLRGGILTPFIPLLAGAVLKRRDKKAFGQREKKY